MIRPALPMPAGMVRRLAGQPLLLLLDVDGTIAPIAPRPDAASVPAETRAVLEQLVHADGVLVSILSGRGADDAHRIVGVHGVWAIGNHGVELRDPSGEVRVHPDVERFENAVAEAVRRSRELAANIHGVVVEDKHWTASVHYRLAEPAQVPQLTDTISDMAKALGLRLTHGKQVLELRPPVEIDKGIAALSLAERLGATAPGGSVFCAGDDRTDEDAFRALRQAQPEAVTVRVGAEAAADTTASAAEFYVTDTETMLALLRAILHQRGGARAA
jgi:trehalose-phosphatase